jgi:anti-sigma regulatory factor (Ser/Thr protein kinase)
MRSVTIDIGGASDVTGDTHHLEHVTARFARDDLHRLRRLARRAGHSVGLSPTRTDDLVLAVSEIATNAIRHGGGSGMLTMTPRADGVSVEVCDCGPGLPALAPDELPAPTSIGGRGLGIVRRVCRGLSIASSEHGVAVRFFVPST